MYLDWLVWTWDWNAKIWDLQNNFFFLVIALVLVYLQYNRFTKQIALQKQPSLSTMQVLFLARKESSVLWHKINQRKTLFSLILFPLAEMKKSYSTLHAADIVHLLLCEASALFSPVPGGAYVGGCVGLLLGSIFASPITFPRNLKEHLKHVFFYSFFFLHFPYFTSFFPPE